MRNANHWLKPNRFKTEGLGYSAIYDGLGSPCVDEHLDLDA